MREAVSYLQLANEYEDCQEQEERWSLRQSIELFGDEEEQEENDA